MKIGFGFTAAVVTAAFVSTAASAYTVTVNYLNPTTSPMGQVDIAASPQGITGTEYASGFKMSTGTGSFVAWCLDLEHSISPGGTYTYTSTTSPYSNSYGLSQGNQDWVQKVFDATYGTFDIHDTAFAAAFQAVLWEAAFENTSNALNLGADAFQASGHGATYGAAINADITTLLGQIAAYNGGKKYNLTYLQGDRNDPYAQNIVTASPVPLPAGGLLLLTALGGLGVARRRRCKAA